MREKIARFMAGRNGNDQLNRFLLLVDIVLLLIAAIFKDGVGRYVYPLVFVLLAYAYFRMLSRNVYKRREENSRWLNRIWRFKSRFQGARDRHADKAHKYYTCKACKTICRVPVGKGKIVITCPKCGAQIHAKT